TGDDTTGNKVRIQPGRIRAIVKIKWERDGSQETDRANHKKERLKTSELLKRRSRFPLPHEIGSEKYQQDGRRQHVEPIRRSGSHRQVLPCVFSSPESSGKLKQKVT